MIHKLKSTGGETIAEVLIAGLVAVLGILLFSTMVGASLHILNTAEDAMKEYYSAESSAEDKTEPQGTGTAVITYSGSALNNLTGIGNTDENSNDVYLYGNDDVVSYGKQ